MSNPLISVIIPAFDAERFIARTLKSVIEQTYRNLEIIVVDDGSTDRTAEIVTECAQRDRRVRLLSQTNKGVAAARNRAIDSSKGEFIAPLDADDLWYPEKLQKQIEAVSRGDDSLALAYTWGFLIDEDDTPIGAMGRVVEGDVFLDVVNSNFILASSPLIRATSLKATGGYALTYREQGCEGVEDWDLWIRLSRSYRFACVPEFLTGYRQMYGSMSDNVKPMTRGMRMLTTTVKRAHPEVPDSVARWTLSDVDFFYSKRFIKRGLYFQGIKMLFRSVFRDPMQALWPLSLPGYLKRHQSGLMRLLPFPFHRGPSENDTLRIVKNHMDAFRSPDLFTRLKERRFQRLKKRLIEQS